ncbi:hypothetical protein Tco_0403716 [Tanacetum coccineum]
MYPPPDPSQLQISHSSVPPSQQYQSHQTLFVPQIAYKSPQPLTQPLTEFPQMYSGLAVPVFNQGDDPIACLNKAMAFLTAVASSRFPLTNNQLRTFSNPRIQATIQGGRVTVQQEGRQGWLNVIIFKVKVTWLGNALSRRGIGMLHDPSIPDGQTAQTTIPNTAAFQTEDLDAYDSDCDDVSNAKAVLMANLSNYGSDVISEVPHFEPCHTDMDNQSVHAMQGFKQTHVADFIDNEITKQMIHHVNNWEKANQEKNNESLTAELKRYKERVKTFEQRLNIYLSTHEKMIDSQMDDMIKEKLALKQKIDSLEQNLSNQIKEMESLLQTFTILKNKSKEKENKYIDKEIDLEMKIKELDNIVYKVGQSDQTVHMLTKPQVFYDDTHKQALGYQNPFYLKKAQRIKPTLYDGSVISSQHVASPVFDDEETLILEECLDFNAELLNKQNAYNDHSKSYSQLEKHCISLELTMQLNQEIFQKDSSSNNQNALEIPEYFENNDLKAQLQAKDTTISKLKEHIKSMRENDKEDKVKHEMDEIETINIELERSVAKLLSENERLHKEIEHLKKIYKDQFDSIKKTRAFSKEHDDSLIAQLNSKYMENADLKCQDKELLVYVRDTCPNVYIPSEKLIVVTPMNKVKKVRFSEPLTSASNIQQVESSKTSYSNTPVMSSTGLKCSTNTCRSQPTSNKKNDRISQTPSSNIKNKVEVQCRRVKSKSNKKNHVKDPICDANVKHTMLKCEF